MPTLPGRIRNIITRPSAPDAKARGLYLDLLIRTLANTIYEDPPIDPLHPDRYSAEARSVGEDWPRTAHSMAGLARLQNFRELTEDALREGIPGDLIETGVWRGGCCILMEGILTLYDELQRKLYVADSFAGLPPPDAEYPADDGDQHHTFEQLAVSVSEVKANFEKYDLLRDNVIFYEGFFEDTLPKLKASSFALLRLDGDMYSSTIVALENLYPKLSKGGYIIIDDYGAIPACKQAVTDYRDKHGITDQIKVVDWTGVWWKKSQ